MSSPPIVGTWKQPQDRTEDVTDVNTQRNNPASGINTPPGRYFEKGTAFNRILIEAPDLARCSDNKTAVLVRPRDFAIRFPYVQINRQWMVSWLILDLDHANSLKWRYPQNECHQIAYTVASGKNQINLDSLLASIDRIHLDIHEIVFKKTI